MNKNNNVWDQYLQISQTCNNQRNHQKLLKFEFDKPALFTAPYPVSGRVSGTQLVLNTLIEELNEWESDVLLFIPFIKIMVFIIHFQEIKWHRGHKTITGNTEH